LFEQISDIVPKVPYGIKCCLYHREKNHKTLLANEAASFNHHRIPELRPEKYADTEENAAEKHRFVFMIHALSGTAPKHRAYRQRFRL
jgi:hypothetical protein